MEIKHEQLRNTLRALAAEDGQRDVAKLITAKYHLFGMTVPKLGVIEHTDGTVDFAAWHNNKQQIFRWLDSDTAGARRKIEMLQPAILAALPAELRARLVAGKSIEYLAIRSLKEHQEAIAAALFNASPADFERECDEAERSFHELRRAYCALH